MSAASRLLSLFKLLTRSRKSLSYMDSHIHSPPTLRPLPIHSLIFPFSLSPILPTSIEVWYFFYIACRFACGIVCVLVCVLLRLRTCVLLSAKCPSSPGTTSFSSTTKTLQKYLVGFIVTETRNFLLCFRRQIA